MAAARFFAKVYNSTGTAFRRVLDSGIFLSVPRIVREAGMPAGDLTIDLAMPYDAFGYGQATGIGLFDLVKIYAVNDANPTGILVYQGHVEELVGTVDQTGNDHVSMRLFPIDALLSRSIWKAAGSYTINYPSSDVDAVFSDAIDDVNAIYGATFMTKNLGNPAVSATMKFVRQTHLAAMQASAQFLPSTWYWRVNPAGAVELQQYADSKADHVFVMGKNLDSVQVTKSLLNTKNKILLSWGSGPTDAEFEDAASEATYGRRMDLVSDANVTDSGSASTKGGNLVSSKKDPATKTTLTVNSLYPIENILPGDTCQVVNLTAGSQQMLSGILRIAHVEYDGSLAILQLADAVDNFGAELEKMIG